MRHNALLAILSMLFGLHVAIPARADDLAYMATGSGNFGVIDLDDGLYKQIGNMGQDLSGLGVDGGQIYGGVLGGDTLYTVNTTTGALTDVGTGDITYYDFGSTLTGLYALADQGGTLYLYSVSTNGTATALGSTGLSASAGAAAIGLSDNSNTLYLSDGSLLYTVNTNTGVVKTVGNVGPIGIGAMVLENGKLYAGVDEVGGNADSTMVETINTTTGATNGPGPGLITPVPFTGNFAGLAADPLPAPDPPAASMAEAPAMMELILTMGLAGLALMWARRRIDQRAS